MVRAIRYLGPFDAIVDQRGVLVSRGEVGLVSVESLPKFGTNYERAEFDGEARGLAVVPWQEVAAPPAKRKSSPIKVEGKRENPPGIARKPAKKAAKKKPAKRKPAKRNPAKRGSS